MRSTLSFLILGTLSAGLVLASSEKTKCEADLDGCYYPQGPGGLDGSEGYPSSSCSDVPEGALFCGYGYEKGDNTAALFKCRSGTWEIEQECICPGWPYESNNCQLGKDFYSSHCKEGCTLTTKEASAKRRL